MPNGRSQLDLYVVFGLFAGEFYNAQTVSCSVCSGASFSDRVPLALASRESTCRTCPRFSISSADGTSCVCGTGVLSGRRATIFANGAPDDSSCIELLAPLERSLLLALAVMTSVAVFSLAVCSFLWRLTRTMNAASPLFSLLFQVCNITVGCAWFLCYCSNTLNIIIIPTVFAVWMYFGKRFFVRTTSGTNIVVVSDQCLAGESRLHHFIRGTDR